MTTRSSIWKTKSEGELEVLFGFSSEELAVFLDIENPAFDELPVDIRGLRSYTVSRLKKGAKGAMEWHKARTEYVYVVSGSIRWTCQDIDGNEKEVIIDRHAAVMTPPTIMHTYEALEDDTTIQVIANTLFMPDRPETHDSYSLEDFRERMAEKKNP